MGRFELAILIPTFNEQNTISEIVLKAKAFGSVIVCDDASTDKTVEKAIKSGADICRSKMRVGYEKNLSRGFNYCVEKHFDYVITLDGDGEHNPSIIKEFKYLLANQNVPLILGVRHKPARLFEKVLNSYFKKKFGPKDILCGMKGYDVSEAKSMLPFCKNRLAGTELALMLLLKKVSFKEVNVTGKKRVDRPRFGGILKANLKLLLVLLKIIIFHQSWQKNRG